MQTSFCLLLLTFATVMSKDEPVAGLFPPGTDYHVSVFFENTVQFCILYVLKSFFPQNHEKPTGSPLKVYGQLNLRNIQGVDDAKMVISLEISLRCLDHKTGTGSFPVAEYFPSGCTGWTSGSSTRLKNLQSIPTLSPETHPAKL